MKTNRTFYFDFIRLLACFLVVCVHVSGESFAALPLGSTEWLAANTYNCLGIIGVPLFFMISGALLLDTRKTYTNKRFFWHKSLPLMGYYFICITLYDLVDFALHEPIKDFVHFKDDVLLKVACGSGVGVGHLWFLTILFSIYLITPIVKPAFAKEENCRYFLILFVIIAVIAHSLLMLPLPYHIVWQSLYGLTPYYLILSYMGYYVLGHYLTTFVLPRHALFDLSRKKKNVFIFSILLLTGCILTITTNAVQCIRFHEAVTHTNEPYFIGHFLAALSIYYLAGLCFYEHASSKLWLRRISEYTLGIYLLHPLVIDLLTGANISIQYPLPWISIPLATLVVGLLSAIPTAMIMELLGVVRKRR